MQVEAEPASHALPTWSLLPLWMGSRWNPLPLLRRSGSAKRRTRFRAVRSGTTLPTGRRRSRHVWLEVIFAADLDRGFGRRPKRVVR